MDNTKYALKFKDENEFNKIIKLLSRKIKISHTYVSGNLLSLCTLEYGSYSKLADTYEYQIISPIEFIKDDNKKIDWSKEKSMNLDYALELVEKAENEL